MKNIEDPGLLNRLALVKQLFSHASEHSQSGATIDKIIAITSLDHAVEMLLEGVIQSFPPPRDFSGPAHLYFGEPSRLRTQTFQVERAGFFRLWDQVTAIFQSMDEQPTPLLKAEMRSLHLARNEAQHSIKVPSSEFLAEMIAATRSFLDHTLQTAFGVTLRQISEALLVRTMPVRRILERAQTALAAGQMLLFAGLNRLAFVVAQAGAVQQISIGRFIAVSPPADLLVPALEACPPGGGLAQGFTQLQHYLTHLHAEIANLSLELSLGLERSAFSRFSFLTPAVPLLQPDGSVHWLESGQDLDWLTAEMTPENTLWLQEYAIATILRWENEGRLSQINEDFDVDGACQDLLTLIEAKKWETPEPALV